MTISKMNFAKHISPVVRTVFSHGNFFIARIENGKILLHVNKNLLRNVVLSQFDKNMIVNIWLNVIFKANKFFVYTPLNTDILNTVEYYCNAVAAPKIINADEAYNFGYIDANNTFIYQKL